MAVTEDVPLHETDIDSVVCGATAATASVVRLLGRDRHRQHCLLHQVICTGPTLTAWSVSPQPPQPVLSGRSDETDTDSNVFFKMWQ